ncbi:unnamed protein product [Closterium sp. Yama58-4]|nr:unnamed protein product [Closterium sp. Yama58-4]
MCILSRLKTPFLLEAPCSYPSPSLTFRALLLTPPHRFQPFGNLHRGVSALVTEAVGSLGAAVAAGAPVVGCVEAPCSNPPLSSPLNSFLPLLTPPHRFQPFGNLHGGVSALVTEAVGSLGAAVAAGAPVVGVEVACSHLRAAPIGTPLIAVGTPLRVGRTVQVWEVRLSASSDCVPAQQGKPAAFNKAAAPSTRAAAAAAAT